MANPEHKGKAELQNRQLRLENTIFPKDKSALDQSPLLYSIAYNLTHWYQALPYGFKNIRRDGSVRIMFLPISPSNIQVVTHYATNVIPTLYGTVEEHSEQRYFDITMNGTTGFSPRYPHMIDSSDEGNAELTHKISAQADRAAYDASASDVNRRDSFAVHEPILGGFLEPTANKVKTVFNKAFQTIEVATDALGITESSEPKTGVVPETSGYAAFHNLYRFFLSYKNDVAGLTTSNDKDIKVHPLQFVNYKDNIQYDVAIRTFTLTRDAGDPMLYNYSIVLRAYNLKTLFDETVGFRDSDLQNRLKTLGLDAVSSSSPFNTMKKVSNGIKGTVGSIAGLGELF